MALIFRVPKMILHGDTSFRETFFKVSIFMEHLTLEGRLVIVYFLHMVQLSKQRLTTAERPSKSTSKQILAHEKIPSFGSEQSIYLPREFPMILKVTSF